jgi:hypothetical protein
MQTVVRVGLTLGIAFLFVTGLLSLLHDLLVPHFYRPHAPLEDESETD